MEANVGGPSAANPSKLPPKWKPIPARERRILGVLVEKAKTTPDQYPMTLNGLTSGCNQKSNRFPQMEVEPDDVEEALIRLRELGAVAEVQGSSRVAKFRHFMYEWLGVEKVELAIMTELLLRGAQTEGELRGRAARMDPIPDLGVLRTLLDSLKAKGLVVSLTSEGRGHVVTHALYEPREMEKLRAEHRTLAAATPAAATAPASVAPVAARPQPAAMPSVPPMGSSTSTAAVPSGASSSELDGLRREVATLRQQMQELRDELQTVISSSGDLADEVRRMKDALGG